MTSRKSSVTVATLVLQIAEVRKNQDDLKGLLLDTLKTMIEISQAQAEANLRFVRLIEGQQEQLQVFLKSGPGTARTYDEAQEAAAWRADVDRATQRDIGT